MTHTAAARRRPSCAARRIGYLVAAGINVMLLQVFPFDLSGSAFDWDLLVRVLLVVAAVGAGIGLAVQCMTLLWRLLNRSPAGRSAG
jgi:hypothetical protein